MATSPFEKSESHGRTLLQSWTSSILLHGLVLAMLLYWFGAPESGLGNRNGSLANFNKVGLEIKSAQTDEFEQRPNENESEATSSEANEQEAAETPEEVNPFDNLPEELTVTPLDEPEPILGSGLPTSVDTGLSREALLSGDSLSQEASGDLPPQTTAPLGIGESAFLGIRTQGEKVIFLLDRSSSMSGTFLESKVKPLAVAKSELKRSLNSLSSIHQFQVIFYHESTRALGSEEDAVKGIKMLPVSELNLNKARNFIDQTRADRGTDHLKALDLAISLHPDVIYFLTDADTKLSRVDLRRIQRMSQGTIINCIEFGKGPQIAGTGTHERNFLQRLSTDTGGLYRYFDITRF
ncbi:hypothetical protein Pla110_35760 [Polystyrenella longa]|uniref:VWFA domain-containing protein n=1 Tax=Polystyrenella longa TaxID=2528007 RepID=A0A518CRI5_9PLAN|nr:hypothetical protein [Polystyrenella longa]QDU81825.1 hypothetical protein Pla110_35760 [Polystyrenella longa]